MIEPHPQFEWRWVHDGLVLPWFTKPCLDWLVEQDLSQKRVFEWGIGLDIPWWCRQAKAFIGIDHDPGIGKDHQNAKSPSNATLCYVGLREDFARECDSDPNVPYVWAGSVLGDAIKAEVVVIDGIYRVGCHRALRHMWEYGWKPETIIVDNAEWPGLQEIRDDLGKSGMKLRSFVQPDHAGGWTTDVWSRE